MYLYTYTRKYVCKFVACPCAYTCVQGDMQSTGEKETAPNDEVMAEIQNWQDRCNYYAHNCCLSCFLHRHTHTYMSMTHRMRMRMHTYCTFIQLKASRSMALAIGKYVPEAPQGQSPLTVHIFCFYNPSFRLLKPTCY